MKEKTLSYKNIGKRIKDAREEISWSQKQLANSVGFESGTAISLIESGDRRVSIEDLEKIAKSLSKDMSYFLGRNDEGELDFRAALRADRVLTKKDQEQIFDFYQFVRNKKNEGGGK